jgi:hypothetical protein
MNYRSLACEAIEPERKKEEREQLRKRPRVGQDVDREALEGIMQGFA